MTYQELEQHYRDRAIRMSLTFEENEIKRIIKQVEDIKLKTSDEEELKLGDAIIEELKKGLNE